MMKKKLMNSIPSNPNIPKFSSASFHDRIYREHFFQSLNTFQPLFIDFGMDVIVPH